MWGRPLIICPCLYLALNTVPDTQWELHIWWVANWMDFFSFLKIRAWHRPSVMFAMHGMISCWDKILLTWARLTDVSPLINWIIYNFKCNSRQAHPYIRSKTLMVRYNNYVHTMVRYLGFSLREQNCGGWNSRFRAGGLTPQSSFESSDAGSRCPEFLALTVTSSKTLRKSLNHSGP